MLLLDRVSHGGGDRRHLLDDAVEPARSPARHRPPPTGWRPLERRSPRCLRGLAGGDLTSAATTAKPLPLSPARSASMVALSASRLVCPAMARISPTTSPIWVAALPSSDMARTVRCASVMRGRPPRSNGWPAGRFRRSRRRSSSTELAAVVTLPEAVPTRSSAVRASAETWSAALLSWVEAMSSRCARAPWPGLGRPRSRSA